MRDRDAGSANTDLLAHLGERYFTAQHTLDPYNATLLGLQDFDHLAGDPSSDASEAAEAEFGSIARELTTVSHDALDDSGRVDYQVLETLNDGARSDARHSLWAANASAKSYVSRQALIFQAIPAMTIIDNDGAERYLSRLSGVGAVLDALGERYLLEADRGRLPTAIGVTHSIQQLEGYLALPVDTDALLSPTNSTHVRDAARAILEDSVRPAMADLARTLKTQLLPRSRGDDLVGICYIPNGDVAYIDAAKRHTTSTLAPQAIHQLGLDLLAELETRWSEIGQRALGVSDFASIASRMRDDPSLRFRNREQIVEVAEHALARAEEKRSDYFPSYDIPDCIIEEINPIDAEHTALAYYRPPAADGSRPGAHCLLTSEPTTRYRYEYEALAFHESTPGHHLQLATAQTLPIPRYRRYLDTEVCGFVEGWGLYAEQLADEMGLYSNDVQRLGMLSFSALRACRLVIDTGIHHMGWSREKARQFMWDHTVTTAGNVRNEVDRYIAWPGQALAYAVGKQQILRFRSRAQAALGAKFSLSDFHGTVLGAGAVPLSVLDKNVARWESRTLTSERNSV